MVTSDRTTVDAEAGPCCEGEVLAGSVNVDAEWLARGIGREIQSPDELTDEFEALQAHIAARMLVSSMAWSGSASVLMLSSVEVRKRWLSCAALSCRCWRRSVCLHAVPLENIAHTCDEIVNECIA